MTKVQTSTDQHLGDVTSIVYFKNHVYTAGADGRIKIWDENLKLIKDISIHDENYIYVIVLDSVGKLYSASVDGTLKMLENPLESDDFKEILRSEEEICAMYIDEKDNLYTGNSYGNVGFFENGKLKYKMNLVEEILGLIIEANTLYTIRSLDLSINELRENGKHSMKASIPGKSPVALFGKVENARRAYICLPTRDGMGITVVTNSGQFPILTKKDNVHEMIVNSLAGTEEGFYSCDYKGFVKKLILKEDVLEVEADENIGCCANVLTSDGSKIVFVGGTDGLIRKIVF